MFGIGPWEMVIILVVALLVLGPRRLPEMLKTVGRVMAELRRAADDVRDEIMFDDEISEIRNTVRDMQDLSTGAVEKLMEEGEKELALDELKELKEDVEGKGQGTESVGETGGGEGEAGQAEEEKEETDRG